MSELDYEAMAAGKPAIPTKVKGSVRPIHNRVIVKHMNFGEQKTAGGIIITSDDGKDRGIKPRWGQVVSKGNTNIDEYSVGDWVLVEHGRWTRTFQVDENDDGNFVDMRTVEAESILGWSNELPEEIAFGSYTGAGDNESHRPEDFGAN